jgi:steroid 5-alpha reductase family enzyme
VPEPGQSRVALPAWLWPLCTGALAIAAAIAGDGASSRRSAAGWMIGSWGARLAVQSAFAPVATSELPLLTSHVSLLTSSLLFACPAFIVSWNADPSLSWVEIAAAGVWLVAFAGETTADRQRLRFLTTAEPGEAFRGGVWRRLPHAHAIFDVIIWSALALFATASPWGWLAWVCPVARIYLLTLRC